MSALGFIRLFLLLSWFAALGAGIYLLLFGKRKAGAIAGGVSALTLIGFVLLGSFTAPRDGQALVQKASGEIAECKALGDKPIVRSPKAIVWDLATWRLDPAQTDAMSFVDSFEAEMDPRPGDAPVTVFLVSSQRDELVGTYSISGQPAYREWYDVYVVQFRNFEDTGTPVAMHRLMSSDPTDKRPVRDSPEYGAFAAPPKDEEGRRILTEHSTQNVAEWIGSLPVQ